MLDFLLVLGQVPGTKFYFTFTELFGGYILFVSFYILRHEYRIRRDWLIYMRLIYVMYSMRPQIGRPKARAILTAHISLIPEVNIDFSSLRRIAHLDRQSA